MSSGWSPESKDSSPVLKLMSPQGVHAQTADLEGKPSYCMCIDSRLTSLPGTGLCLCTSAGLSAVWWVCGQKQHLAPVREAGPAASKDGSGSGKSR